MNGEGGATRDHGPGRSWLIAGLVLAVGATAALVFSEDIRWVRLGIVAALWAALLAAFLASRYRRQADRAHDEATSAQEIYELELEREIAARREYELELEGEIRRDLQEEHNADLQALRDELSSLRDNLERLFGGELLYERVALTAQSTRMRSSQIDQTYLSKSAELDDRQAKLLSAGLVDEVSEQRTELIAKVFSAGLAPSARARRLDSAEPSANGSGSNGSGSNGSGSNGSGQFGFTGSASGNGGNGSSSSNGAGSSAGSSSNGSAGRSVSANGTSASAGRSASVSAPAVRADRAPERLPSAPQSPPEQVRSARRSAEPAKRPPLAPRAPEQSREPRRAAEPARPPEPPTKPSGAPIEPVQFKAPEIDANEPSSDGDLSSAFAREFDLDWKPSWEATSRPESEEPRPSWDSWGSSSDPLSPSWEPEPSAKWEPEPSAKESVAAARSNETLPDEVLQIQRENRPSGRRRKPESEEQPSASSRHAAPPPAEPEPPAPSSGAHGAGTSVADLLAAHGADAAPRRRRRKD